MKMKVVFFDVPMYVMTVRKFIYFWGYHYNLDCEMLVDSSFYLFNS